VTVSGNYAALANGDDGLRVFDVSTPSNPINVAIPMTTVFPWAWPWRVITPNLANGDDGLRIYDISTPGNPVNVGHANAGPGSAVSYGVQ